MENVSCSCPGCDQSGTSRCSACKEKVYCGPICQSADWANHKEECDGYLLKVGNAHIAKAKGFYAANNFVQTLRYGDLALVKLNAMKKRPLEAISEALACKCEALKFLERHTEALQCAKDKYNMWAMARGPAHPFTIEAAFYLIDCLMHNKEFEDANLFARTLWEIIHTNNHVDNDIPADKRQEYVATAAKLLAQAIYGFASSGGIPPEEKQKAGEEAIARARQSLEINTQMYGAECGRVAADLLTLGDVLSLFNDDDDANDDEAIRLYDRSIAINIRVNGSMSVNVGAGKNNLGLAFKRRAGRAYDADDFDQCIANLELALSHYREAVRILRALDHVYDANITQRNITATEEQLRIAIADRAESRG